jgi:hypothetical protein
LTPEVWIALFGLIGTLGAGLGGTALNNRAARAHAELQWNREVGEKSRLERLDAYEEFASLVMLLAIGLGGTVELESMMRSLHRLEIRVSPDTGAAARELFLACTKLVTEGQKPDETRDEKEVRRLSNQVYELRTKLVDLAQKESIASEVSLVQKPEQ